jgi:hypothetical protein
MKSVFSLLSVLFTTLTLNAADVPATLMTKPGKLIYAEDFSKPLPPPTGSTAHYASGYQGWRRNVVERGGTWEVAGGEFTGRENPKVSHPATASYAFDFKNVVISCEVRLNDVPMEGRKYRSFSIRTTDEKDYVCSIILSEGGMRIQKDDNDHGGPDKAVPLGQLKAPIKLGDWQRVTFEILGDEMVGTLSGQSLTGSHPLITTQKRSIMFVAGVEGSVRDLKIWAAEPNPDWTKNKAKLGVDSKKVTAAK